MFYIKIVVFFLVAFMWFDSSAIGFNEALAKAYRNNPSLEAMRENLKSVDENMPGALSGWLPTISASMDRGKRDTNFGGTSSVKVTDTRDIELNQPLFRGGQTISEMKKAKNTIIAARATLRSVEQDVLLEAVTAYMDIIRDREVLELTRNNIKVLTKHLEVTEERFSLGEVTKTDVAQAEVSLAIAISEKINAGGTLESSKATYERIIGEEPVELENIDNPITINASLEDITGISLKENPLIKIAEYNKNAARNSISLEKGKLLPRLDLLASRQKQKGALFSSGADIESDSFSFSLAIPLYQSGAEYSRIRQAKYNLGKLKYDLIDQQNKIREAVVHAYNNFQVARATIKSNQATIGASKIVLEGTQQEAKVGARTTLDVLDAEQDLFEAKANLVRSKRDEIVSSYTLLAQVGRLNVGELGLDVEVYDPEENYNKRKYQIIGF